MKYIPRLDRKFMYFTLDDVKQQKQTSPSSGINYKVWIYETKQTAEPSIVKGTDYLQQQKTRN